MFVNLKLCHCYTLWLSCYIVPGQFLVKLLCIHIYGSWKNFFVTWLKWCHLYCLTLDKSITVIFKLRLAGGSSSVIQVSFRLMTEVVLLWELTLFYMGWDSVVSIATCNGLDGLGIRSWWGQDFLHLSEPMLGPAQPSVQLVPVSFLEVKRTGHSVDHSPPSSVKVTEKSYTSTPPLGLHGLF
jgi:hypothetical protein